MRTVKQSRLSAFDMLQRVKFSIMVFYNFHVTMLYSYIPLPLSIRQVILAASQCYRQHFSYTQVNPHVQKLPDFLH